MQVNQFPEKAKFLKLAENHNVIPVVREILADTETPVSLMKCVFSRKNISSRNVISISGAISTAANLECFFCGSFIILFW